ncbi:hypothetical protein BLNAU_11975 [Blattamonas nauphoetae]|uniref:Uncharacterized protein n=1 Tax=Blattamonas nauphoetae TaxID=2049346 RepID=A0ABQ9XKM7_9EUKA|nr:hypothetical protein BLNAU_11975 [Blattamonas nauphoetae]
MDYTPLLNWSEDQPQSEEEMAVVLRSLVAAVKLQPALDDALEDEAMNFLKYVETHDPYAADAFLRRLGRTTDESLTNFVQSIVVLLSSANQVITTTAMEILKHLIPRISAKVRLALVKADLVSHLINILNPLSLSFAEAADIHITLVYLINWTVGLSTPMGLRQLAIEGLDKPQTVYETVLQQVLVPSEKYIWHFCVNRFSMADGDIFGYFLRLLAQLLRISPYYPPTMDFVLHMPVILLISSCLTFFENDGLILSFLIDMIGAQREWNKRMGEERQLWKTVHRMLRMEGIEDMNEGRLRNNKHRFGYYIVARSIEWNNLLDMNAPLRR